MRLKSLKLSGFKSFANPTTFSFRHGITAIVGPNGCGKSNVIDAIRWVLGESSAKQLRGGAMSDVIFAGTQNKAAKSLASVELTFEHTQDEQTGIRHELNLYHELSVRRQINGEGKSDYFINGTRCRRRDVVDVFLGTGLGPRSYSVIQQGMIGRIVDSSPLQLREFIEEAAGVSRYQARREETQKKLLRTRENLERLQDIEAELSRQKKKLAKQAESATHYQQLQQQLSEVKEQLGTQQLYQAKAAQMQHKAEQEQLTKSLEAQQAQDSMLKQKMAKVSARLAEEQWLKDEARDSLHQQDLQRQQVEHQLKELHSSLSQLEGKLRANADRQQKIQASMLATEQDNQAQNETLTQLAPELEALQVQQQQTQEKYAPLQSAWEASNTKVAKIEADKREVEQRLALAKQSESRLTLDLSKWHNKDKLWQQEAIKWGVRPSGDTLSATDAEVTSAPVSQPLNEQIAGIDNQLKGLAKQQEVIEEQLETKQPIFNQLKQTQHQQQSQLAQLEKQHASLMAEYDTLHAIVHPKKPAKLPSAQPTDGAQSAADNSMAADNSTANRSLGHTLGQLSALHEQIKLTAAGEPYAQSLDKWLAFWLDAGILRATGFGNDNGHVGFIQCLLSDDSFDKLSNKPQSKTDKSAAMPPQSVLFEGSTTSEHQQQDLPPDLQPYLKPLTELIAAPKLRLWQHTYLYVKEHKTDEGATDLALDLDKIAVLLHSMPAPIIILTQAGWLITRVGAVHISKLDKSGQHPSFLSIRLQQQQRLAVLEAHLNETETQIEQLTNTIKAQAHKQEQLSVIIEELLAQLSASAHERHELQQQRITLVAKQERQDSEQQRLQAQRDELDAEQQEIQSAQLALSQKIDSDNNHLQALMPELKAAKQQQQQLELERQQVSQQERDNNDSLRQIQLQYSQAQIAAKHSAAQLQQFIEDKQQLERSQQKLIQDQDKLQQKLPQLQVQQQAVSQQHHELKVALDERQAVIGSLQGDVEAHQARRDDLESHIQQLQDKLSHSITQVAIADERIKEASERLKGLNTQISPLALLTDYITHGRSVSAAKLEKLQAAESQLTAKLNNMGPVNLAAAAELAAVDERLLPLEQQINDITASMDTLSEAIASIDGKTKTLFLQTLDSVNESLTQLFTKVFGGGQASLTLLKDDELGVGEQWRAGLELMAQPKGKKNSRLAVLSGGEKTLTALSLIFAIFKQHPAPFCVLDEVDAPLDDANVVRFTNLIADLADEVQFIFISHNKLAMQIADELKGVTMPQAGISTLVSVSLEEAEQYLEPSA